MGLIPIPQPDSPHYSKAVIISKEQLQEIFHTVLALFITPSTVWPVSSEKLDIGWHNQPFELYFYYNNNCYSVERLSLLNGSYVVMGKSFLKSSAEEILHLNSKGDITTDLDGYVIIKEGKEHTHNPSRLTLFTLERKLAGLQVNINKTNSIFFKLNHNNVKVCFSESLDAHKHVCVVILRNTLTQRTYRFYGDFPTSIGIFSPAVIREAFSKDIPDFFTVESVDLVTFKRG